MSTERSNESWVAHLTGGGPEQNAALRDLRQSLLRGLRRALATHSSADEALLEDAVQDALVRILGRIGQFEGRSRFVTWAMSITVRVALSELRRHRWKDVSLEAMNFEVDPRLSDPDDPDQIELWERKAIVEKMYELINAELTEKQRQALLAELKGVPQTEIARQLRSNRNAVYKLTHDARKRLKRGLEAAGYRTEEIRSAFAT